MPTMKTSSWNLHIHSQGKQLQSRQLLLDQFNVRSCRLKGSVNLQMHKFVNLILKFIFRFLSNLLSQIRRVSFVICRDSRGSTTRLFIRHATKLFFASTETYCQTVSETGLILQLRFQKLYLLEIQDAELKFCGCCCCNL